MAELTAVLASTHHPFYYKATTSPEDQRPPYAADWQRKVEATARRSPPRNPTSW